MKKLICKLTALALFLAMTLSVSSCDSGITDCPGVPLQTPEREPDVSGLSAVNLNEDYISNGFNMIPVDSSEPAIVFAIRMMSSLAGEKGGESVVISPYSILTALALTANGAAGETLSEMEATLGFKLDELNEFLPSYTSSLPSTEKSKLTTANSIWIRNDGSIEVKPSFIQRNVDLYRADAYAAPFDESTLYDVNKWISDRTDGMIGKMLEKIDPATVMYLINAVLFDAEWQNIYYENFVVKGAFTNAEGKAETADFMYDSETGLGFRLNGAVGLVRDYAERGYEFVAVLPNGKTTPEEYLRELDPKELTGALTDSLESADTCIPKFSIEYSAELKDVLRGLGMKVPFDPMHADFSELGTSGGNIYISNVIHRAKIEVNERGTKAGAATVVDLAAGGMPVEKLEVRLDRPFIFFINDKATHTPIFCGIVNSVA